MSSKYGNHPAERDGIRFASLQERQRYDELKLLEAAGAITDLRCQPRYELQPAFTCGGRAIRRIEYVGDFAYTENSTTVCEDVKGMATDVFKLKWKLVRFRFPGVEFRVV